MALPVHYLLHYVRALMMGEAFGLGSKCEVAQSVCTYPLPEPMHCFQAEECGCLWLGVAALLSDVVWLWAGEAA
eukprot:scaffold228313_cov23-Tisochrysis_lutea.AAC.1